MGLQNFCMHLKFTFATNLYSFTATVYVSENAAIAAGARSGWNLLNLCADIVLTILDNRDREIYLYAWKARTNYFKGMTHIARGSQIGHTHIMRRNVLFIKVRTKPRMIRNRGRSYVCAATNAHFEMDA